MALLHRAVAAGYYARRVIDVVARSLGVASDNHLRVLLYHDIAPTYQARFGEQMRWLRRHWRFVSPTRFAAMVSGEEVIRGRNVLLTFDDGYASNRVVAEKVLNPMNIQAIFFAIPAFVSQVCRERAREFIAKRIIPGSRVEALPAHLCNMQWSDLEALIEQGHSVGAHTETHARLSQIASESELEREIVASADTLEHRLGTPVDHFAYPFGNVHSINQMALRVARRRFRFIHSGLRGDNAQRGLGVRRDAATPSDTNALIGAWVEGVADFRYARSRAKLDAWL